MIQKTVLAMRDFQVRKTSILAGTTLAGKIAADKQAAEWVALENEQDIQAEYTLPQLLEALNKLREQEAKDAAKTSSPWTPIETMVEMVCKNQKKFADNPQLALDMLISKGIIVLPTFISAEAESTQEAPASIPEPTEPEAPASGKATNAAPKTGKRK